jgi:hypothetical protein
MNCYKEIFLSKEQYLVDSTSDYYKKIPQVVALINQYAGIDFDWNLPQNTNLLTEEHLMKIQQVVSKNAQTQLVSIIAPYIKPYLKGMFGDRLEYVIRVSAQVKGRWDENVTKQKRKVKWIDGVFFEDDKRPNLSYPTRGHQDLDNNGNRSSHTIIFYFQLTHPFDNASLLEYATFGDQIGILQFHDTDGYSNEILPEVLSKLKWQVAGLNPGNIALMTGLSIHRSTLKADIPRVALNVKIQPTNLDYLETIYGYDITSCKNGNDTHTKLLSLYKILLDASKKSNSLLFETAITALLLGNLQGMSEALKAFCLFDVNEEQMHRMALGGILRRIMINIKKDEFHFLENPLSHVVPFSCADGILSTIGESGQINL